MYRKARAHDEYDEHDEHDDIDADSFGMNE